MINRICSAAKLTPCPGSFFVVNVSFRSKCFVAMGLKYRSFLARYAVFVEVLYENTRYECHGTAYHG